MRDASPQRWSLASCSTGSSARRSLGALAGQVKALEELPAKERRTNLTLAKRLEQERKARADESCHHLELEERIQGIHDSADDLARERRTVAAL